VSYEFPNHYLFESWEDYEAFANDKPPCFRWLGQQVAILMGSELAAAGRNTRRHRHHHLAWAEVMAAQTELLQQIVKGQQPHHQQRGGHNAPQPQVAGYPKFFGKQPPLFNKTEEPLDANAWFHTIESKFALLILPCPEANKA
jgi:hypothetical protein